MMYSIDRLEGDFAVATDDNDKHITIPKAALPSDIREGDIVEESNGGYTINAEETKKRREKNAELLRKLLSRKKNG